MSGRKTNEIVKKINEYVSKKRDAVPNFKECCLLNNWDYDDICDEATRNHKIRKAIKNLLHQREINLEKGGITGEFNKPFTVHLLEKGEREMTEKTRFELLNKLDNVLRDDKYAAEYVLTGDENNEKVSDDTSHDE